jgi:hypothetical protein
MNAFCKCFCFLPLLSVTAINCDLAVSCGSHWVLNKFSSSVYIYLPCWNYLSSCDLVPSWYGFRTHDCWLSTTSWDRLDPKSTEIKTRTSVLSIPWRATFFCFIVSPSVCHANFTWRLSRAGLGPMNVHDSRSFGQLGDLLRPLYS